MHDVRAAWATDLHLEFATEEQIEALLADLVEADADCLLLGGDIDHGGRTMDTIARIADRVARPVYFVLGNHDYYGTSIEAMREATERRCGSMPQVHWLNREGTVALSDRTALIGHDGWADGRLGDYAGSDVELNDYYVIDEFKELDKERRLEQLRILGDEAARHFRRTARKALRERDTVVVLTHVPPFRESCWHGGRISTDAWLPHFACKTAGDALSEVMRSHPSREMLVLCGHTHGAGEARVLQNLRVLTGGARYGEPAIQRVLELP